MDAIKAGVESIEQTEGVEYHDVDSLEDFFVKKVLLDH